MSETRSFIHLQITDEAASRLRGRQSVRTTFRLSERSINALSVLAGQLQIKQKSLFDHLVEDLQALKAIAQEAESFPVEEPRVAKTYVISRQTLENLERISRAYNAPRDMLVEVTIERILPLIEQEKEKHARRSQFARRLGVLAQQCDELLDQAAAELGEDDPLVEHLLSLARASAAARQRVEAYLEKARRIEEFKR